MPKDRTDVVTQDNGDESHPAFGLIGVHRITATPGEVLFQSDLRHREYIRVEVHEATRKRDLKHDWVHPGKQVCAVSMSLAQFASFVTSGGTSGVPCTIDYAASGTHEPGHRPGLVPDPRLALTATEVRAAADQAYGAIQAALAAYEAALADKTPAAVRREALRNLHHTIGNAAANVAYATKMLDEHAEAVVEKSRADIEAMVLRMADQLGVSASEIKAIEG